MLLHVLRHVEPDQSLLRAEQEVRQGASHLGLAHTGRSQEEEGTHWTVGTLEPRPRPAYGPSQSSNGLVLADDALVQPFLDTHQLGHLLLLDGHHGNPRPFGDNALDVFLGHRAAAGVVQIELLLNRPQVFQGDALLVAIDLRLFELIVGDGRFHASHDHLDLLLNFRHLLGEAVLAQLDPGARFIDQIDGLVRQETIRNVAIGLIDGGLDGRRVIAQHVKLFVALLDPVENSHGFLFRGRRNLDRLKPSFERSILLDGLAELSRRGGPDTLDLPPAQSRLQDVGGVQRALCRTGAHQGMQLIHEHDRIAILYKLLHDRLQPFLELAPVLGAGHDQRKVESQNSLVGQIAGHLVLDDSLRQTLDDSRLADSRLANQNRIVLGAPAENLDHPFDFIVSPHQGIQRAFNGQLGQIPTEFRQQGRFLGPAYHGLFRVGPTQLLAD